MTILQEQYEKETGKQWWVNPCSHGEKGYASWEYQLWLENKVNQLGKSIKSSSSNEHINITCIFEDQLRNQNISFYRKGDTYIINDEEDVYLHSLTSLPNNIEFNNRGSVYLDSLTSLPDNIEFNNKGNVYLDSLTSLPENKYEIFKNEEDVYLHSLTSLPNNIVFNNEGSVDLNSLISLPENKYEIFKNGDKVYYNNLNSIFNPHQKESKSNSDLATEVKNDIEQRIQKGVETYGERLKTNNGRIALQDAYEKILDLALYIKQELKERESN